MDTIYNIENELQDILYHLEELKSSDKRSDAHIAGIIRSAGLIEQYAIGIDDADLEEIREYST